MTRPPMAITDIEKMVRYSNSAIKMKEEMLYKPWGVMSSSKTPFFLKSAKANISKFIEFSKMDRPETDLQTRNFFF